MKKIILFSIISSSIITLPLLAFADSGVSLDEVLSGIKASQNVSENSQLKCENVSDDDFEKLGNAVMGVMHPNEQEHELMDQMMGGEGSQSLRAAHIYMGKKYLGCTSGTSGYGMMGDSGMMGGGMMGMMGGGMMGNYGGFGSGMMGSNFYGWNWFGLIFQVLILVLIILGIVAAIKWISKQDRK